MSVAREVAERACNGYRGRDFEVLADDVVELYWLHFLPVQLDEARCEVCSSYKLGICEGEKLKGRQVVGCMIEKATKQDGLILAVSNDRRS